MSRHAAEKRGRGAERIAAWWLRLHGWRILAQRARVRGGEVDIVARRRRTLAFVEVKARATDEAAAFSLDAYRLRRVVVAAERYADAAPKGEIVIVVGPPSEDAGPSQAELDAALLEALKSLSPSRAAAEVAERLGVPRKQAYARALELK